MNMIAPLDALVALMHFGARSIRNRMLQNDAHVRAWRLHRAMLAKNLLPAEPVAGESRQVRRQRARRSRGAR